MKPVFLFFNWFKREKETSICGSIHSCIHCYVPWMGIKPTTLAYWMTLWPTELTQQRQNLSWDDNWNEGLPKTSYSLMRSDAAFHRFCANGGCPKQAAFLWLRQRTSYQPRTVWLQSAPPPSPQLPFFLCEVPARSKAPKEKVTGF